MSPARRRLLLVDDEPKIVDGLQRTLRPHRATWEVATATSGAAALALLEQTSFDVLVSDMRMPEMDGAMLLAAARSRYPATIRIVLSGQTDAEAALRAVPVAHQFLGKPTDPAALLDTLNRLAAGRDAITEPTVLAAVGALDVLPSSPAVRRALNDVLGSADASPAAIAAVAETDPAIALKLLHVANSAFFGLRRQMCSVSEVVSYLGAERLRALFGSGILEAPPVVAALFDEEAERSRARAAAARARASGGEDVERRFLVALVRDIGKLAMAATMPAVHDEVARRAASASCSFEEAERALGVTPHRAVADYLLELWGLPGVKRSPVDAEVAA